MSKNDVNNLRVVVGDQDIKNSFDTQSAKTYTVKPGDTMWGISKSQGISVGALERANPGVDAAAAPPHARRATRVPRESARRRWTARRRLRSSRRCRGPRRSSAAGRRTTTT